MKTVIKTVLILGVSILSFTLRSQEITPHLARMNTLTFRIIPPPSKDTLVTHIHHLVRTIYRYNSIPDRTLLQIGDNYFMAYRNLELLPTDNLIFILSRGYAKSTEPGTNDDFIQRGACAKVAYLQLKDGIVPNNYPVVSFDYNDDRS